MPGVARWVGEYFTSASPSKGAGGKQVGGPRYRACRSDFIDNPVPGEYSIGNLNNDKANKAKRKPDSRFRGNDN
jgi:hypothetical protein